jgi:cobalt-zinc-cadmium efflux system membrane fusion protein
MNVTERRSAIFVWLWRALPTMVLVCALAGIALGGHYTGWKFPKFSDLTGNGTREKEDWCPQHSVPESLCVECNESLMPRAKATWCRTHGVFNCPFERPEVAQLQTLPQITNGDLDRAQRALDLKERPENSPKCKLHDRRIQFVSAEAMDKMGIDVAPAWEGPIVETVKASGEITFEEPRVAPLFTPVAGRVWKVADQARLGVFVKEGELLALVDAIDVGKAKAEFFQALSQLVVREKTHERLNSLVSQGAASEASFRAAEAALKEAQIRVISAQQALVNLGLPVRVEDVKSLSPQELSKRMQFLGLSEQIAKTLDPTTTTANLIPVKASRGGFVKEVKVVKGEMVDASRPLFVVADTSWMWLILNVRMEDVRYLRIRSVATGAPGQPVRFRPDGSTDEVTGELVWRSTTVDKKTRTVQFRAELPNADGLLLANAFGTGSIVLRAEKKAIVVPNEALHWEGDCHIVFVRDKDFFAKDALKVFHVRTVRPGVKNGSYTEIIAGLLPGEVVATRNSANLRAELLKNNLGAA